MSAPTLTHHHAASSAPSDDTGNRRSACDRCRSHKLRCERDPDASQCRRCVKANAECVTSATLKSGRPLQLYGMRKQKQRLAQENHQPTMLDFPTPPPTTFDTSMNVTPHCDGDLDMQFLPPPSSFNVFDDMWSVNFEQQTTIASLAQPVLGSNASQDGDGAPSIPLSEIRSGCLKKLGELQRNVLADLEVVKACKTADKCPQTLTASGSTQSNFLVGRMLDHSTALIEILDCFELASKDPAPPSNDHEPIALEDFPKGLFCDTPTLFSLLSCYVCLIRIYRTIFSSIHDSMPFLLGVQQPVPQLFPGMNLGGFKLESRIDLQVQILVQVSQDLLTKIEAKFGIEKNTAVTKGKAFGHERATKMLRLMLEEEAGEQPELDKKQGHCEPLKDILASLKHMIQMEGSNNKS